MNHTQHSELSGPAAPPIDASLVRQVAKLLIDVKGRAAIVAACLNVLSIEPSDVDRVIHAAIEIIRQAAEFHSSMEGPPAKTL